MFTTNCLCYDTGDYADDDAVEAAAEKAALVATPMYGGVSDNGAILIADSKPSAGPVLMAVEKTTMPDGQFAIKFQVLEA